MASLLELPPSLATSPLSAPHARTWVGRAVWALAALAVAGLFAVGGAQPADPYLATSRVPGYDESVLQVVKAAPGSATPVGQYCALQASTALQHAAALENRRDLAGYAVRVFRWSEDVDVVFYNRNVPVALTVAWFDKDGNWIGSRDLEPCPDVDGCPTIAAPVAFRSIVEVEKGGLSRLGLGPGSQIAFASGC